MTDARPFHFLHFSLFHHRSTMKVGTDAILLGRWAPTLPTDWVLDIGTGCGLLPLMLAQKGIAGADAVDLDMASAHEAAENFAASQWRDLLHAFHADIRSFDMGRRYDLIITNPPFFTNFSKGEADRKNQARHTEGHLAFQDLVHVAYRLLKPDGRFVLVLPCLEAKLCLKHAQKKGGYLHRQMLIVPVEGEVPNRINMELRLRPAQQVEAENFVIRKKDGGFTKQYTDFLKDYYLGLGDC